MKPYHPRDLEGTLGRAVGQLAAVVLTGPRQSGKTTLVRTLLAESHEYVTLDDPVARAQAADDPKLLLARRGRPLIVDEIQYAPSLLHAIKADIDAHRDERGRFVITGSQAFPLMQGVTESLAGRAAVLSLQSFGLRELWDGPRPPERWQDALAAADRRSPGGAEGPRSDPVRYLLRGGFPEPALRDDLDRELWLSSYVQTYLERDVRTLRAVGDLTDFQRFLFALAARSGSLINYADLGRDLGLSDKTVKAWVSVLEASGQAAVVKPYHASLGKRLVKRPKVYFHDSGVLAYLLGLSMPEQVTRGVAAGPVFESAVFGQLHRLFTSRGQIPRLSFWRTAAGEEVDFVLQDGPTLIPIEAKLTATPTPKLADGIHRFQRLLGARAGRGLVVCLCSDRVALSERVDAVPLGSF